MKHFGADNLQVTAISKDSVTVSWSSGTQSGNYEVRVKPKGERDDNYTLVCVVDGGATETGAEHEVFRRLHEYMVERISTIHAIFWEFDKDRSGHIDAREFQKAMKKLGVPLTSRELGTVLLKIDENHDGKIEYKELVHTIQRHMRRCQAGEATGSGILSARVPGLAEGNLYTVQVSCTGERQIINVTPLGPPNALTATVGTSGTVELRWNPSKGATQYRVGVRREGEANFTTLASAVGGQVFVADSLGAGETYQLRVSSGNDGLYEATGSVVQAVVQDKPRVKSAWVKRANEDPERVEKSVDMMMEGSIARLCSAIPGLSKGAIRKVGSGAYQIGSKKVYLSILNEQLMVRVGGGYQEWNEFIDKHYSYLRSYVVPDIPINHKQIMSHAQKSSFSCS